MVSFEENNKVEYEFECSFKEALEILKDLVGIENQSNSTSSSGSDSIVMNSPSSTSTVWKWEKSAGVSFCWNSDWDTKTTLCEALKETPITHMKNVSIKTGNNCSNLFKLNSLAT